MLQSMGWPSQTRLSDWAITTATLKLIEYKELKAAKPQISLPPQKEILPRTRMRFQKDAASLWQAKHPL